MDYGDFTNEQIATAVSLAVVFDSMEASARFESMFEKSAPPSRTIRNWRKRFMETLSVLPCPPIGNHKNQRLSDETRESVITAVVEDPRVSQRKAAAQCGVSQSSVQRILGQEGIIPWKFTTVQELLPDDAPKRLQFCHTILDNLRRNCNFVKNICFSDEATFNLN